MRFMKCLTSGSPKKHLHDDKIKKTDKYFVEIKIVLLISY